MTISDAMSNFYDKAESLGIDLSAYDEEDLIIRAITHMTNNMEEIFEDDELPYQTSQYWDCECASDYIHPKIVSHCPICDTYSEDQPDSIVEEVLAAGFSLKDEDDD